MVIVPCSLYIRYFISGVPLTFCRWWANSFDFIPVDEGLPYTLFYPSNGHTEISSELNTIHECGRFFHDSILREFPKELGKIAQNREKNFTNREKNFTLTLTDGRFLPIAPQKNSHFIRTRFFLPSRNKQVTPMNHKFKIHNSLLPFTLYFQRITHKCFIFSVLNYHKIRQNQS